MPNTDIFLEWFKEARNEITHNRDRIEECSDQIHRRIGILENRQTQLEAEVKIRNKIIWSLIGLLVSITMVWVMATSGSLKNRSVPDLKQTDNEKIHMVD